MIPANEQDHDQAEQLARRVQRVTAQSVELAYVDQGYTGDRAAEAAEVHGMALETVKLPEAKKGFVLVPRRWVVERSFGWLARFRRLARDYERLPETVAGLHLLAFVVILVHRLVDIVLSTRISAQHPLGGVHKDVLLTRASLKYLMTASISSPPLHTNIRNLL